MHKPEVSEQVREWNGLSLTAGEQTAFARAAMALKYDEAEEARHDKQIADKMAECNARVEYMNNTLTRLQKEIDKLRAAKNKLVVETVGSSPEYGTTVVVSNRIRRSPKR